MDRNQKETFRDLMGFRSEAEDFSLLSIRNALPLIEGRQQACEIPQAPAGFYTQCDSKFGRQDAVKAPANRRCAGL
ncbi:MAG TPA: hypothetical protein VGO47_05120 [Chlamydiales bacterium]|nr:hypothetical protein [Chlamydiales bacterium]